ncbi:hypothetical protein [Absidia glauca]|uniref:BAG domain-containing protein n=1 Tax=Absidia glauca TaxID=4829 RepID=A0A168MJL2_ABSGL|nr:hypothetical protein [Absidia glauca]
MVAPSITSSRTFWVYATAASVTLIATSALVTYKLVEQDRRIKQKKHTKQAERQTLQLIHQIQLDRQTINKDIDGLKRVLLQKVKQHNESINDKDKGAASDINDISTSSNRGYPLETAAVSLQNKTEEDETGPTLAILGMDDKEWKRLEFIVVESNELLLRLLERLDAVRPRSAIIGDEDIHEWDGSAKESSALEEAAILEVRNRKKKVIRQIERNFRQLDQCKDLMNSLGGSGGGGGG